MYLPYIRSRCGIHQNHVIAANQLVPFALDQDNDQPGHGKPPPHRNNDFILQQSSSCGMVSRLVDSLYSIAVLKAFV